MENMNKRIFDNLLKTNKNDVVPVSKLDQCPVCGKTYKSLKVMANHCEKEHYEYFEKILKEEDDKKRLESIINMHRYFFNFLDKKIEVVEKRIEELKTKFNEDPVYFLQWNTKEIIYYSETLIILKFLNNEIKYCKTLEEISEFLKKAEEDFTKEIIARPPEFRSSSLMSNYIDMVKNEAICDHVGSKFGNSVIKNLCYLANDLIKWENEEKQNEEYNELMG